MSKLYIEDILSKLPYVSNQALCHNSKGVRMNIYYDYTADYIYTGQRSAVSNESGCRYLSDCRARGCKFDPGPVPYFLGD